METTTTGTAKYAGLFTASISTGRAQRGPLVFWTLLRFVLSDYARSPWLPINLLVVALVHLLLFTYSPDLSHFFGVEYAMALVLGGVNAAALFSRANRPETYPILARPVPRASFVGALMLAAWLLTVLAHLISSAAVAVRFGGLLGLQAGGAPSATLWRDVLAYLNGSLPVVAIGALAVSLVAMLSSFVSPSGVRLGLLAVLAVLVMSFDSRNFPIEQLRPYLQQLPPMLAPAAEALKYATEPSPDQVATLSLMLVGVYALVLTAAVLLISSNRELTLD
jgi:hypothetical protein